MPRRSDITRLQASAEILAFLLIERPAMVTVGGVEDVQIGSGAQRFLCTKARKQGVGDYRLLALGAEGAKRLNETPRHGRELYPSQLERGRAVRCGKANRLPPHKSGNFDNAVSETYRPGQASVLLHPAEGAHD